MPLFGGIFLNAMIVHNFANSPYSPESKISQRWMSSWLFQLKSRRILMTNSTSNSQPEIFTKTFFSSFFYSGTPGTLWHTLQRVPKTTRDSNQKFSLRFARRKESGTFGYFLYNCHWASMSVMKVFVVTLIVVSDFRLVTTTLTFCASRTGDFMTKVLPGSGF